MSRKQSDKEKIMNEENENLLAGYEDHEISVLAFKQKLRRKVLEILDEMGFRPSSVNVVLAEKADACGNHRGEKIKIEIQSKPVEPGAIDHPEGWPI